MLVQFEFEKKDENGIYNTGFATVQSPSPYQVQQQIFEVITIHGPGVPSFTRDELKAFPMGVIDPDCFRTYFKHPNQLVLSPNKVCLSSFQASFDSLVNKLLADSQTVNNTMESVAAFVPVPSVAALATPPAVVPPSETHMTVPKENYGNVSLPAAVPVAPALDDDDDEHDNDEDEDDEEPTPSPVNLPVPQAAAVASGAGAENSTNKTATKKATKAATKTKAATMTATKASSEAQAGFPSATGSAGKRRKSKELEQTGLVATPVTPEAKKAPVKRRFTKKLDAADDSDDENVDANVQLTPLRVVAQVKAVLASGPEVEERINPDIQV